MHQIFHRHDSPSFFTFKAPEYQFFDVHKMIGFARLINLFSRLRDFFQFFIRPF